ncbi:MAG: TonB-dependent receptor [Nannocystis sp.]|uniref:TonB-dependent receptor plug domain-containing protein n=1 Tax=Nannocystis sp. TaxID=1962667 RepID=UPI002428ED9D|nr:TonB-dependent receptor [Nannocystis sp.]MBK9754245.1 TonB-dependent receptor [Nannocystis sp.]
MRLRGRPADHPRAPRPRATCPKDQPRCPKDQPRCPKDQPVPKTSPPYRTVVAHGRGDGLDAQRRQDAASPGFATSIELANPTGARPADGLPELLGRSAGATVRSLGGLGQFSALSLRGSSAQQVSVFLDGVPIGGSGGVVNLGDLPLDSLGRVTIHRGLVPVAYGGAAIGGALDLGSDLRCDPTRRRFGAVLGLGSFGASEARASTSLPLAPRRRGPCLDLRIGHAGATGDFRFHNLGETLQDPRDDRNERRQNNDYDRLLAQLAVHGRAGAWRYSVQELLLNKHQGIPGLATGQQARATRLDTLVARSVARVRRELGDDGGRPGHIDLVAGFAVERTRYRDPLGEVGLGIDDQRTRNLDLYLSPRLTLDLWRGAQLLAMADARQEWSRVDQRLLTPPQGDSNRQRVNLGLGLQLDQHLAGDRLHLQPIVRLDVLRSRFAVPAGSGEQNDQGADHLELGASPRLAARLGLVHGLSLRLAGGRYFRPPSLLELFGDRGYIVGNEGLRPERGSSLDGGFILDLTRARTSLYAHAAGFVTWSDRLIQWQQAGPSLRPVNVARARVSGFETSAALRLLRGDIRLSANYTLLAPVNLGDDPSQRGQPLPGRPRHELFAQGSFGHVFKARRTDLEPRLVYSFDYAARTFLDPSGRYEVPSRALHGLAVELHLARRVHLAAEVRNLFNLRTTTWRPPIAGAPAITVPVSDFFFYPLPGTSLWTTLRVELDAPARHET